MKKLFVLFLLAFMSYSAYSQEKIKWYGVEEAFNLQKKKPKKILIDVYTDWCGWCKKMDATTFVNPKVAEYLNKYYYCVKFNAEGKEPINILGHTFVNDGKYGRSHEFAMALFQGQQSMGFPAIAYFSEKGDFLSIVPGFQDEQNIMPILAFFGEDFYKTKNFQDFSKEYKAAK